MATLQEQIIETLLSSPRWHERADSPSRNYVKIVKPAMGEKATLWVGKAGALRRGRTISESISLASGKAALEMVRQWCAAVNPWARWASQSECKNAAGEVVALIVMCGPTMYL